MKPKKDHIQITVKNLESTELFFDQVFPLLGFNLKNKSRGHVPEHAFEVIEYNCDDFIIGFNSPRKEFENDEIHRRKPGAVHHIAFKASTKIEVDNFYLKLKSISKDIIPPQYYPQHGESYYAIFFKDLDGIKWEFVFEE